MKDDGIDCILMDLEMPIMSGIVAATEIRNREESSEIERRIPIIAVTGNARTEYVEKSKIQDLRI
jgi:CheY-like chemotaxis protein